MSLSRLFAKKQMTDVIAESKTTNLKRTLGAWNLISLGVGALIGAGIFVITGTAAANHAGPAIVLSFILSGMACCFTAFCYAELASSMPVSGSAYTYSYVSMGEIFAWIMGWLLVLEYGVSSATVAVGWSGYFVSFMKDLGVIIPPEWAAARGEEITLADGSKGTALFNLPAFVAMLAVTGILIRGIKESANFNNFMVLLKVAVVLIFIGVGAFHVIPENWQPFIPEPGPDPEKHFGGMDGILTGAGSVFFAYIGFEAVSTAAQEAKNPQRDLPIGIIGSLIACTILYILVSLVLTGVVHYSQLGVPDPIAVGVDAMNLPWLAKLVKFAALMGLSSVMLVTTYGQTRVFYVMSKDGLLPPLFSKVHDRFKTPHINTMIVGVVLAFVSAITPIKTLGDLVSMGTLTAFAVVCFSVLYLRVKNPELERPFKCPLMPIIPVAGILFCGYLVFGLRENFHALTIWIAIGFAIYGLYGFKHSLLNRKANN